jgi:ABC-type branched-subunit amino acid transport system substrate-binding protein
MINDFAPDWLRAVVLLLTATVAGAAEEAVTLTFVGPSADAYKGFLQALDESNRQGRFLGFTFEHERIAAVDLAEAGTAGALGSAIFVAGGAERVLAVAEATAGRPVFNLTSPDDALRERCLPGVFHTAASDAMLSDAVAQWASAGNSVEGVVARVWNTQFRRYAAIQLSQRFEGAQGIPLSDQAYAGWAAAKLYAQVVMAQGSADPGVMLQALREDVAFDGQKGVPMQFRASGQLNQMILLEKDGKVLGQAPVRGVRAPHELESLGFTGCKE